MRDLQGTRLPDAVMGEDGPGWEAWNKGDCAPGSYMKVTAPEWSKPLWYINDPLGHIGSLRTHTIEEHDDGTITVTPSILDNKEWPAERIKDAGIAAIVPHGPTGTPGWHGWLTHGVWLGA